MLTEQNSLLDDQLYYSHPRAEDPYNRFSNECRRTILALMSFTGFVCVLVLGSFVPLIPQISQDLRSTPADVSLGASVTMLASSLGVMFWSAYSSYYGRRFIYILGTPFAALKRFAVAASANLPILLLGRFVQVFGYSCDLAVAAAMVGDIYKLEERGTIIGTLHVITLLGLAVAPLLGGVFAQYWPWRIFQAALGMLGVVELLLLVFFFPETAQPGARGIDKVQGPRKLFVWVNPFRCIAYLRSPNIIAIALAGTVAVASEYSAYTIGAKYRIRSDGIIGLLLLLCGLGNCAGALIAGRSSDWVVRYAKEKRNGLWVPEDRLRAVWIGGLVLVPISVTLAGFIIAYVDGMVGLTVSIICLFCSGGGVIMVIGTYVVDIMPFKSAEVIAAIGVFRLIFLAPMIALLIPPIETIGVAATNGISGILALVGYPLIWLTIRYGKQLREWVDIGYPDFDQQVSPRSIRN